MGRTCGTLPDSRVRAYAGLGGRGGGVGGDGRGYHAATGSRPFVSGGRPAHSTRPQNGEPGYGLEALEGSRRRLNSHLAVQGTLKSLLQHHSSNSSILQHSAFFMVQLSQLYVTTGKTIALTVRTFVGIIASAFLD